MITVLVDVVVAVVSEEVMAVLRVTVLIVVMVWMWCYGDSRGCLGDCNNSGIVVVLAVSMVAS